MDTALAHRLARARFRAWHRGTREADFMIGGFFDTFHAGWDDEGLAWFEALLDQDDVDVMAWALGTRPPPTEFAGDHMAAMQRLDYVRMP
ncbi:succinate dehydrogenase assembly factor 2 [Tsuneonella sp. SYSU-LHT278]|uniref:FAD assembly factor SdhE n=1 Tax=Tsuneonella sediminis TaxID=3416089 RepID=UPI003F7912EE